MLKLLPQTLDCTELHWLLLSNPNIWNDIPLRTQDPSSPHYGISDIWVRYALDWSVAQVPHTSDWYPIIDHYPLIKTYCFALQRLMRKRYLGGILITKIPAGVECRGHIDTGWHAAHYEKYALQITSAPGQYFWVESTKLETQPNQIYTFDNSKLHGVKNNTDYDRITLIVCMSDFNPISNNEYEEQNEQ